MIAPYSVRSLVTLSNREATCMLEFTHTRFNMFELLSSGLK